MIEDVSNFIVNNNLAIVGITGGAGSGKSFLTHRLGFPFYSIDAAFIGDSEFRRQLLSKKERSYEEYLDAINQYNWWNWDLAESHVRGLMANNYPLIVEGAFLGNPSLLELYGAIIFIQTDERLRFNRLVKRDGHKRTYDEMIARWDITNSSEATYYGMLFQNYADKIYIVDSDYDFTT